MRAGGPGRARLQGLQHLLHGGVERLGQLLHGRGPTELVGQLLFPLAQREVALLRRARRAHRPGLVPQRPLELAVHGAAGERGERDALLGIEPVHGAHHREQRGLAQVVDGDAPRPVPDREAVGEPPVLLDDLVAHASVAGPLVLAEQLVLLLASARECSVVGALGRGHSSMLRGRLVSRNTRSPSSTPSS